ncbi:DUF3565 domain-containing protein [Sulfuricaulis sp.]|uniref:DUF3565 domain-containing protein n=1 Tax=Sulfuricaulis sp. TaxID=2003553 RepID=UPI00345DE102
MRQRRGAGMSPGKTFLAHVSGVFSHGDGGGAPRPITQSYDPRGHRARPVRTSGTRARINGAIFFHMRHNPPWTNCPWVMAPGGRALDLNRACGDEET